MLLGPFTGHLNLPIGMEEERKSFSNSMIQLNLVRKVEPVEEFLLSGEYVDTIPTNFSEESPNIETTSDPLRFPAEVIGGNLKLQNLKNTLKDCKQAFSLDIKTEIKDDLEEYISNENPGRNVVNNEGNVDGCEIHAHQSYNHEGPEAGGFLWSCCSQQFEAFSVFNKHKVQEHNIEENRCSVCTNRSFATLQQIEKHYLNIHCNGNATRFRCVRCKLVFGMQKSFFEHREKCTRTEVISAPVPGPIIDVAIARQDEKNQGDRFKLSCCGNIIGCFQDFVLHKAVKHKIDNATCGLCFNKTGTIDLLRNHYQTAHFKNYGLVLEKAGNREENADESVSATIEADGWDEKDESSNVDGEVRTLPVKCTVLQDGILCQCPQCSEIVKKVSSTDSPQAQSTAPDKGKSSNDDDKIRTLPVKCTALQDGILCQCPQCSEIVKKLSSTEPSSRALDEDDNSYDYDEIRTLPVKCTALQDGILCKCPHCSEIVKKVSSSEPNSRATEEVFTCELCKLQLCSKAGLRKHLKRHEGIKEFPCDICKKAFTTKSGLEKHTVYTHTTDRLTCNICHKYSAGTKSALQRHINIVHLHAKKNILIKCEHCEKAYTSQKSFQKHLNNFHLRNKEFTCDHCKTVFYDKGKLIFHIQRLHLPNEKFKCEKCEYIFNTQSNLYFHKYKNHSSVQYNCDICGKICKSKTHFKKHMPTHSDEKPFSCQSCGKSFKRAGNLQQHQYTHSEARPFNCDICGETFRLRTHIKQHMAVHGLITNHKCCVCNQSFANKRQLSLHLSEH